MTRLAAALWLWALLCGPAAAQDADLAARSNAASVAMSEGRYDEAATIYRELLGAMPNEPGLLMNLGMALAMAGREADAIAPLERAITLNPKLLPAHLFLGSSHLARGEFEKAIVPLERVVAAQPTDVEPRRRLAQAYIGARRPTDAVVHLRRITQLQPKLAPAWYALGHGYNAVTQDAIATFEGEPPESPWRRLLLADALHADGRLTDAFALYREALAQLPSMVTIHDSIARIYEVTGHADWAAQERKRGMLSAAACAKRKALCAFRNGRYRDALAAALARDDPESRYWRTRAANELALAAFKRLEELPDSRERREVRATLARAQRRYLDAIAELKAALQFAPSDPGLLDDLATSYYFAKDYEQAIATLEPLVKTTPDDVRLLTVYGDSLLNVQRVDDAIAVLRRAMEVNAQEQMTRLTLGRAYVQSGNFAEAIPLIEPHLPEDHDGSLHAQLSRAYTGSGQPQKAAALLERSQELQRAARERADTVSQRAITPPK